MPLELPQTSCITPPDGGDELHGGLVRAKSSTPVGRDDRFEPGST